MPPPDRSSPYRLLVEGIDDQWSIINLLSRHGYDWDDSSVVRPYVHQTGGISPLLESLAVAVKSHERLGIVVDADLSINNRWASVRDQLVGLGFEVPSDPIAAGAVVDRTADNKRVGVWLMPDNQSPGSLEDFLAKLVPEGDPCWGHAETTTTAARDLGAPLQGKDQSKGVIHTWLAWREDPGQPFGQAITARALGHDSPEALQFVDWFNRMFA